MTLLVAGQRLRGAARSRARVAGPNGLRVWAPGGPDASRALLRDLLERKRERDWFRLAPIGRLTPDERRRSGMFTGRVR